jgi:plastocyanin
MDRRALLGRVAALATAGLAGCAGGDGSEATEPTTATRTERPTASPSPEPTDAPTADRVVDVGPGGELRFDPSSFEVAVGETVRWTFRSAGHNVKADTVPEGADWTGTPGGEFDTVERGATHVHTFDVAGEYAYYCGPHRSAGMVGTFTVAG